MKRIIWYMYKCQSHFFALLLNLFIVSFLLSRLTMLSEDLLLKHVGVDSLESITVLNLHNNGISKLKPIQSLVHLRRLTVSFNELSRLDEVANMVSLKQIDCSCVFSGFHMINILLICYICFQFDNKFLSFFFRE